MLGRLAEAFLLAGSKEQGLEALEQSFSHTQEVWWFAEQYRIRAELLLLEAGSEAEAEILLRTALKLARSQKSRSLELRAAMSLARLLRQQGRVTEGRALLARSYASFTEGFDTADLQEAKELLDALVETEPFVPRLSGECQVPRREPAADPSIPQPSARIQGVRSFSPFAP